MFYGWNTLKMLKWKVQNLNDKIERLRGSKGILMVICKMKFHLKIYPPSLELTHRRSMIIGLGWLCLEVCLSQSLALLFPPPWTTYRHNCDKMMEWYKQE